MPDESDLRDLFEKSSAPNTLNADRIIAKSRARRLPKQVGAGLVSTLAVAGIFVVAINTSSLTSDAPAPMSMEQSDSAGGASDTQESIIKRAPADRINLCTAPVADVAASVYGLQLDVQFPATAPIGTAPVEGTVRMTNVSAAHVVGTTAASPAITLSQNGVVQWHSNGPMIMSVVNVDLEPGQSIEYPASFTPVKCDVEDDTAEAFRADLPALHAGDYELSALIDFSADESIITDGVTYLDLVSGPRSPITLG